MTTDQSKKVKPHPVATPTNEGGPVPVISGANEPSALSSFKRHMGETYSSDDDDVFLPNPPSKTQADKCIVAMDTEGEEERGVSGTAASSQAPRIVVTPGEENAGQEGGKEEEEEVEEKGEEERDKAMPVDSAAGTCQSKIKFSYYNRLNHHGDGFSFREHRRKFQSPRGVYKCIGFPGVGNVVVA
jgi:hypothetical protein